MVMSAQYHFFFFPPSTREEQRKHQQLHLTAAQLNSNLESPFLLILPFLSYFLSLLLLSFFSFGGAYLGQ
jgi:hypothetical protein